MDITEGSEHLTEPVRLSTRPVVVGVDGSKGSSVALTWAARVARMRHRCIRARPYARPEADWRGAQERPKDPGGRASASLTLASEVSEMDITEGSEHLTEPVRLSTRPVVVGVDGSKGSSVALTWAAREARMRHVALTVIHTWRIPALAYNGYFAGPVDTGDWRRCAVESTEQQIVDVLGEHPDLEVVVEIKEGDTAHVLVEASHDAEVLVVGSRGHGGFGGLLLGSVSSQVAHHAICPVVIVHDGA